MELVENIQTLKAAGNTDTLIEEYKQREVQEDTELLGLTKQNDHDLRWRYMSTANLKGKTRNSLLDMINPSTGYTFMSKCQKRFILFLNSSRVVHDGNI